MENNIKTVMAVILNGFAYLTNGFGGLITVLVLLMLLDYLTGIILAYINKNLESRQGFKGILKKMSFVILVLLGFFADVVITYLVQRIGLHLHTNGLFGIATTCWLISNESLSIIENLGLIGVPIPTFLKKAFVKLKDISEDTKF